MPEEFAKRAVKAVVPAAGLATRFLPATKAMPKEMLPVVDRPVLQYVVEEAAAAGITDVLLVTGRGKTSIVDHFDRRPDLEAHLEAKGDQARLDAIRHPSEIAEIFTARQGEALGLGHAVSIAEAHIGDQSFAVLLGDEFIDHGDALLPAMIDLQASTRGIVLAFLEVPWDEVSCYGVASVEPTDREDVVRVTGLVEKPARDEAPSNLIVIGRYILPRAIFDALKRIGPGSGGEIQLTDAMALMLAEGTPVHGIVFRGRRHDTGAPLGYLQTVVRLACDRDDLGPEFRQWLVDYVTKELASR